MSYIFCKGIIILGEYMEEAVVLDKVKNDRNNIYGLRP